MHIVCLSGGTGGNAIAPILQSLSGGRTTYILPVSDNGGSTSEILRVLGGPGVGDLRSRLVRLIPSEDEDTSHIEARLLTGTNDSEALERSAVRNLLAHRLAKDATVARLEFFDLVEARATALYDGVSRHRAQALRSFLVVFQAEVARLSTRTRPFDFSNGSVGNFVLTGMRLFFGSVETAVLVFAKLTGVPEHTAVIPVIETVETTPIAATLADGTVIAGQNEISHPAAIVERPRDMITRMRDVRIAQEDESDIDDAGGQIAMQSGAIHFDKDHIAPLPSRIASISYIDRYGRPVRPRAAAACLTSFEKADCIVLAPGSLYTSIVPTLLPRGCGEALRRARKPKIVLLNGSADRETPDYTAADYLDAIAKAAGASAWSEVCTHLVYLRLPAGSVSSVTSTDDGESIVTPPPVVDEAMLKAHAVKPVAAQPDRRQLEATGLVRYDPPALQKLLSTVLDNARPVVRRSTVSYSRPSTAQEG